MSSIFAYERDPYATRLDVEVTSVGEHQGRPYATLSDTLLYPEGGGQPSDHGELHGTRISDVQRVDGEVLHFLEGSIARDPGVLTLDWQRRYDHMQQHTAQHLLTAIAADRFGWPTTSFHLQPGVCDIELDVASLSAEQLATLEEAVAAEVRAAHPVTTRRIDPADMAGLEVRSRGLPEGHQGDVRLVEIAGLDINTCGGTHLRSTAEIEAVKLLGTESRRGGIRLMWVAGTRVRQRLGAHESRNAELRKILGAGDDELAGIAQGKLDQLKDANRQLKALAGKLAEATAQSLSASSDAVLDAHFESFDMGFLQQIARRFSNSAGQGIALLTVEGAGGCAFVLAAAKDCPYDVQTLGRKVAEVLGGRGGGSGRISQGKAESLARREEALKALEDAV